MYTAVTCLCWSKKSCANLSPPFFFPLHATNSLNSQVNFKFENSLRVYNELRIGGGGPEAFTTDFKFSTKAVLVVGMTNKETAADLVSKIRDKFNILEDESGDILLFEREVSVRQQDIFYRRVGDQVK